jgi:hypothetical protein
VLANRTGDDVAGGQAMSELLQTKYDEWARQNADLAELSQKCDECNGRRRVECPHCGHEDTCEACAGRGYTGVDLKNIYKARRLHDEISYDRFFNRAPSQKSLDESARLMRIIRDDIRFLEPELRDLILAAAGGKR